MQNRVAIVRWASVLILTLIACLYSLQAQPGYDLSGQWVSKAQKNSTFLTFEPDGTATIERKDMKSTLKCFVERVDGKSFHLDYDEPSGEGVVKCLIHFTDHDTFEMVEGWPNEERPTSMVGSIAVFNRTDAITNR